MRPKTACLLGLLLLIAPTAGGLTPPHAEYNWTVTREYHNPDGYWRQVYKVNGEFPGPTIRVVNGGRLIVRVENLSDRPVALHWHG
eukprot:scaffold492222_cov25-Prasinocladus_malaysianus.AAC.1